MSQPLELEGAMTKMPVQTESEEAKKRASCSERKFIGILPVIALFAFTGFTLLTLKHQRNRLGLSDRDDPDLRSALMVYENAHIFKSDSHSVRGKQSDRKIKKISLIGERNSGTTWIVGHLEQCFSHSLDVSNRLVRYKHWFQDDIVAQARVDQTLVVAMFRNPYHWAKGMQAMPHHAPLHYLKDWEEFLTKPWTMPRALKDLELLKSRKDAHVDESRITCVEHFTYNEINSCVRMPLTEEEYDNMFKFIEIRNLTEPHHNRYSSHNPQYELKRDGSGEPFPSLLDLRSEKIKNIIEIAQWDWIKQLITVQYEELLQKGTAGLIEHIEELTGVEAKCEAYSPQTRMQRTLEEDLIRYIRNNLDWETEKLIGYTKLVPGPADSTST